MNKEIEKRIHEFAEQMYQAGYEDGTKAKDGERGSIYYGGYSDGYKDGQKDALKAKGEIIASEIAACKKAYEKGLKHGQELRAKEAECAEACGMRRAWNVARKILSRHGEGYDATDMEVFGTDDVFSLSASEAVAKLDEWETKQSEKCCATCVQPRDYKNSCIPYKEGKCDKSHKAWIPKQEQTEKSCEKCKWMELDCANPAICKDMALYEPKDIEEDVKVGDTIRTIKDKDYLNIELFPIGTIGRVIKIESEDNFLRYKVRVGNECWLYSRDMFEVINQDAPESNVESIAVWDEVEDNLGNRTIVTHIYSDGKDANADVIDADGCFRCLPLELLEKTGRRFCFQELLDAMKKDDVEEADTNENK